jgi:hypothetical protein
VGEVRAFNFSADVQLLESSVMGDDWVTYHATATLMASWNGGGECLLDYDDTGQAEVIDAVLAGTPAPSLDAVLFGTADEDLWYAQGVVSNFSITGEAGSIFTATFSFTGTGSIRPRWD